MNEYNKSISSLSQYQTKLESSRHVDYMGQGLENFPLLSDELRSLALFMRQDHRMNGISSEAAHVVTYRNEEQQRQSRQDLNQYLNDRQSRIGRDNTPHTFSYQVEIGGHTYGFTSVGERDRFFNNLERGLEND